MQRRRALISAQGPTNGLTDGTYVDYTHQNSYFVVTNNKTVRYVAPGRLSPKKIQLLIPIILAADCKIFPKHTIQATSIIVHVLSDDQTTSGATSQITVTGPNTPINLGSTISLLGKTISHIAFELPSVPNGDITITWRLFNDGKYVF